MPGWLTPARRRGVELLDDPATADEVRERAMADVARSNALFGGSRAVARALRHALRADRPMLLLDLGTGTADIPARITKRHPDVAVVGSSPELMTRVRDGMAFSRPIAGTRPRGASEELR